MIPQNNNPKRHRPVAWETSLPWSDDQFILVNGNQCVYTVRHGSEPHEARIDVKMPGCLSFTVEWLRVMGYDVKLPKKMRLEMPAAKFMKDAPQ